MKREIGIVEIQQLETEILQAIDLLATKYKISYHLSFGSLLGAIRHSGPIPWDTDLDIAVPYPELERFIKVMKKHLPKKFVLEEHQYTPGYNKLFPRIGIAGISTDILHADVFYWIGLPDKPAKQKQFVLKQKILDQIFRYKNITLNSSKPSMFKLLAKILLKILLMPITNSFIVWAFNKHCNKYPYDTAEYITQPCGYNRKKNILKKSIIKELTTSKYAGILIPVPQNYDKYLKHFYGDYMQYPPEEEQTKGLNFSMVVDDIFL